MRIPDRLASLVDEGIIEEVLRPLMSGKEAQVYLVLSGGEQRVAKVYKEAQDRTFKQRAEYTEGRAVRNTRDQRAIGKRTRYGRAQDEAAWQTAEVDMMYRLSAAGVRVPKPHHFIDGVLVMELITDAQGNPAPRVGEAALDRERVIPLFDRLLAEVVRMLAAGVVHGDLSEFNVLLGSEGPVVIDFPQAVNASGNQNARRILLRDVDNLQRFLMKFAPERRPLPYAQEMWQLFMAGELTPDTQLTGRFRASEKQADTAGLLALVADVERDERKRREQLGQPMRGGSGQQRSGQTGPMRGGQGGPQRGGMGQQRSAQGGPAYGGQNGPQRSGQGGPPRGGQGGPPRNPTQGQRGGHARPPAGPIVEVRSAPRSQMTQPAQSPASPIVDTRDSGRGISSMPPPQRDQARPTFREPARDAPRSQPDLNRNVPRPPQPAVEGQANAPSLGAARRRRRRKRKPGGLSAREP